MDEGDDRSDATLLDRVRRLEEEVASLRALIEGHPSRPPSHPPSPAASAPVQMTFLEAVAFADPTTPRPAQPQPRGDIESQLATYWLSRVGIVALISGLAFLIIVHFGDLGPVTRVAVGYALAGALSGLGLWLARQVRTFGDIVFAGGLAVAYFVTYALHFVASVRVINNQSLGLVLVVLAVVGVVAAAQKRESETVAGIALFLGLHASLLSDTTALTLACTSLLAAGAAFFLARNRWVLVPLSTMVAVYTSHAVWSWRVPLDSMPADGAPISVLTRIGFLVVYFSLFEAALLLRSSALSTRVTTAFAGLNVTLFIALAAFELRQSDRGNAALFFAITGVALAGIASTAKRREAATLLRVDAAAAALALALAAAENFSGHARAAALLLVGAAAVGASARLRMVALYAAGLGILAAAWTAPFFESLDSTWLSLLIGAAFLASARAARRLAGSPDRRVIPSNAAAAGAPPSLDAADRDETTRTVLSGAAATGAAIALMRGIALLFPSGLTTLAWVATGFIVIACGIAMRERSVRWAGLGAVALSTLRLIVHDLAAMQTDQRILTLVLLGACLLAISFVYARFKDRLRPWL